MSIQEHGPPQRVEVVSENGTDPGVVQTRAAVSDVTATWTSATAQDTALTLAVDGYDSASLQLTFSAAFDAGVLAFEHSVDGGTTWFQVEGLFNISSSLIFDLDITGYTDPVLVHFRLVEATHFRIRLYLELDGAGTLALCVRASAGDSAMVTDPYAAGVLSSVQSRIGATDNVEATGDGSLIAITKRLRTLLSGGFPAALGAGGGLKVDGSGTALPVSATSLPLPTGAATSAKQDTIIGHIDGVEALLAGGLPAALSNGRLKVEQNAAEATDATATWTSATAEGSTLSIACSGMNTVLLQYDKSGSITGGSLYFEASADGGSTWQAVRIFNSYYFGHEHGADSLSIEDALGGYSFTFPCAGYTHFHVALNAFTGAGSVGLRLRASAAIPTTTTGIMAGEGDIVALGTRIDSEATGDGSLIAITKRLRTLLSGGLPAALGVGGGLKVDGSGTALPVSGTVSAAQSGTWTVQPGNTANTTAWKVDGSAVTQPVSAASLPLPTGAATAAKQDTEIGHLATLAGGVSSSQYQTRPLTTATDGVTAVLDFRRNSTPKKYMITVVLTPGAATAGTNLMGVRKQNANADCYISRIICHEYHSAASVSAPIGWKRATTVAGGSQVTAADIPKLDTAAANATLEVRTGAVTVGAEGNQYLLTHEAPATAAPAAATGGGYRSEWVAYDRSEMIRLTGDEGLILELQAAGDTDARYHVTLVWEEA